MNIPLKTTYTLKKGDNLYKIAQYYNTTVEKILSDNKHLNPNNLMSGEVINIELTNAVAHNKERDGISIEEFQLSNGMRMRWEEHVMWTRSYIISVLESLPDSNQVVQRLLENPNDIAALFSPYYPVEITQTISKLLTEHLTIAAALLAALKAGDMAEFDKQDKAWYKNADDMANAFSSINPYYKKEDIKKMLYHHLDLTKKEAAERNSKKYADDIRTYDEIQKQALFMADMFTKGLIQQFPNKF